MGGRHVGEDQLAGRILDGDAVLDAREDVLNEAPLLLRALAARLGRAALAGGSRQHGKEGERGADEQRSGPRPASRRLAPAFDVQRRLGALHVRQLGARGVHDLPRFLHARQELFAASPSLVRGAHARHGRQLLLDEPLEAAQPGLLLGVVRRERAHLVELMTPHRQRAIVGREEVAPPGDQVAARARLGVEERRAQQRDLDANLIRVAQPRRRLRPGGERVDGAQHEAQEDDASCGRPAMASFRE
jgi:hypothetical protein